MRILIVDSAHGAPFKEKVIQAADFSDSWTTVVSEQDAARAIDAVLAIARDLSGPAAAPDGAPLDGARSPESSTIVAGYAGQAIFFAYLEQNRPGEGFAEQGVDKIERAIELLAAEASFPGLYQGFSGVAWAAEHLQNGILAETDDDEDLNAGVDETLLHLLRQSPWPGHYDLISGLVGLAVYALSRLPRAIAVECLDLVVDRLAELAVEQPSGFTWFTPRDRLVDESYDFFTGGNYNLGVAHGVPGVIAVLARICGAGIAETKACPLLEGAVSWLLSQRLEDCRALFPTAIGPGVEIRYSRAAWCYGDPGIAATLLTAARAAGVASWEREALEIARHSAARPFDSTLIRDGCLCHGSAGLGHLFNRMYQATGDEVLGQAALSWYRWTLDQRRPGQGIGGFLNWSPTPSKEMVWQADPSFLSGAVGMGLALLAAATPVEPRWDELLLLSPLAPAADGRSPAWSGTST
ncbi:MAG TPA: lanthionine synthetase C family protein [Thermoanaerobaculia bacterium]